MPNSTKELEGWFIYAEDSEYGPTLLRWKGKDEFPTHPPNIKCDYLEDDDWEEVWLWGSKWKPSTVWHSENPKFEPVKVKIVIEQLGGLVQRDGLKINNYSRCTK